AAPRRAAAVSRRIGGDRDRGRGVRRRGRHRADVPHRRGLSPAGQRVAGVDPVGRGHGRGRRRRRGRLSREPRGAARSHRRAAPGIAVTALFEGVGIALASLRAHKMRAAPKIEGGAIHPGRSFSHVEDAANSHVAVVNTKLAENLFGQRDPTARRIKISGVPYDVIGVYDPPPHLFGGEEQPQAMIPHGTFAKDLQYWRGWMDMFVVPQDSVALERAMDEVTMALRTMRGLPPGQRNNLDAVTQQVYV